MTTTWHPVYRVRFNVPFPDPDLPDNHLHNTVFVETGVQFEGFKIGTLHHVTGNIAAKAGMKYTNKVMVNLENSPAFRSKELLGYTRSDTHPKAWERLLVALPTPPQQKAANPSRGGRIEPFKQKIRDNQFVFYKPEEERRPIWKCTKWTENYAIPALQRAGLIKDSMEDP